MPGYNQSINSKSQWKAILRYHKLAPCVVSEKNWNTELRGTNDTCIVCTLVGETARLRMKQC